MSHVSTVSIKLNHEYHLIEFGSDVYVTLARAGKKRIAIHCYEKSDLNGAVIAPNVDYVSVAAVKEFGFEMAVNRRLPAYTPLMAQLAATYL